MINDIGTNPLCTAIWTRCDGTVGVVNVNNIIDIIEHIIEWWKGQMSTTMIHCLHKNDIISGCT